MTDALTELCQAWQGPRILGVAWLARHAADGDVSGAVTSAWKGTTSIDLLTKLAARLLDRRELVLATLGAVRDSRRRLRLPELTTPQCEVLDAVQTWGRRRAAHEMVREVAAKAYLAHVEGVVETARTVSAAIDPVRHAEHAEADMVDALAHATYEDIEVNLVAALDQAARSAGFRSRPMAPSAGDLRTEMVESLRANLGLLVWEDGCLRLRR